MASIQQLLGSSSSDNVPVVLVGLGGIGKTQTVAEYAYRFVHQYSAVWWLRSSEPQTLLADQIDLARTLKLPGVDLPDRQVALDALRHWLAQNGRWLIILDDVQDPAVAAAVLPPRPLGHVLITSRNPNWRSIASPLAVAQFTREESIQFLHARVDVPDADDASDVSELMSGLPLALEQAASYVEETQISFRDYARLFRAKHDELWRIERAPVDYPDTVATTWTLSVENIHASCPLAINLLRLFAFLAPDDIPRPRLAAVSESNPTDPAEVAAIELRLNEAIAALRRFSLIIGTSETLSIHPLVQLVTRDAMKAEEVQRWLALCVRLVDHWFPEDAQDVRLWGSCTRALPHGLYVTAYAASYDLVSDGVARVLHRAGVYLRERAEYLLAEQLLERSLTEVGQLDVGPSRRMSYTLNNLGTVLVGLGKLDEAMVRYRQALDISRFLLGEDDPEVATQLGNMAEVLRRKGDVDGAIRALERARDIDIAVFGEHSARVSRDLNNLGIALQADGRPEQAITCYEKAVSISEGFVESKPQEHAVCLQNLATCLHDMREYGKAKLVALDALKYAELAYGPDHPTIAMILSTLGGVCRQLGESRQARRHLERAVGIAREKLGTWRAEYATLLSNLAGSRWALNDKRGATKGYEEALSILTDIDMGGSLEYASICWAFAPLLRELNERPRAIRLLQQALRIRRSAVSAPGSEIIPWLGTLGEMCLEESDNEEAIRVFEELAAVAERKYGLLDPWVALANGFMGEAYSRMGNTEKARRHFGIAFAIRAHFVKSDRGSWAPPGA